MELKIFSVNEKFVLEKSLEDCSDMFSMLMGVLDINKGVI